MPRKVVDHRIFPDAVAVGVFVDCVFLHDGVEVDVSCGILVRNDAAAAVGAHRRASAAAGNRHIHRVFHRKAVAVLQMLKCEIRLEIVVAPDGVFFAIQIAPVLGIATTVVHHFLIREFGVALVVSFGRSDGGEQQRMVDAEILAHRKQIRQRVHIRALHEAIAASVTHKGVGSPTIRQAASAVVEHRLGQSLLRGRNRHFPCRAVRRRFGDNVHQSAHRAIGKHGIAHTFLNLNGIGGIGKSHPVAPVHRA